MDEHLQLKEASAKKDVKWHKFEAYSNGAEANSLGNSAI